MAASRVLRSLAVMAGLLHEASAVGVGRRTAHGSEGIPFKEIFGLTTRVPFGCRKPKEGEKI
eukprot:CAMPEP_0197906458 /NCGR_PEP_ID=MMETSP1439-20131203/62680_1 /TAXON_ID=66791 /ORGANISM="Gonyaulax spinifera, Strain CCMP409" /LENGTH=61 /DNA_ID=CAMNT_0043527815 /DNA_START=75 /DNA_END=257 /DNA_ORIENTATION=-